MKKNILAIAILAAVIANIILSAVTLFSVVPAAKNVNGLVEKICQVINLDLQNPDASTYAKVPVEQRQAVAIGSGLTVNLKKAEGETKSRYALINFNIIFNNKASNFATVSTNIDNYKPSLNEYLSNICSEYTAEELLNNKEKIKKEMISYSRSFFTEDGSAATDELVVDVTLTFTVQ